MDENDIKVLQIPMNLQVMSTCEAHKTLEGLQESKMRCWKKGEMARDRCGRRDLVFSASCCIYTPIKKNCERMCAHSTGKNKCETCCWYIGTLTNFNHFYSVQNWVLENMWKNKNQCVCVGFWCCVCIECAQHVQRLRPKQEHDVVACARAGAGTKTWPCVDPL